MILFCWWSDHVPFFGSPVVVFIEVRPPAKRPPPWEKWTATCRWSSRCNLGMSHLMRWLISGRKKIAGRNQEDMFQNLRKSPLFFFQVVLHHIYIFHEMFPFKSWCIIQCINDIQGKLVVQNHGILFIPPRVLGMVFYNIPYFIPLIKMAIHFLSKWWFGGFLSHDGLPPVVIHFRLGVSLTKTI